MTIDNLLILILIAVAGSPIFYIYCRLATAAYFKSRNDAKRQCP